MIKLMIDATGWIGAILVLYAYMMVSTKRLEGNSLHYQAVNIAGAFCLMVNTYFHQAYPSAIVNVIWIGIGFYSLQSAKKQKAI
jgi:fluoride ion exporter CrcB/FEX